MVEGKVQWRQGKFLKVSRFSVACRREGKHLKIYWCLLLLSLLAIIKFFPGLKVENLISVSLSLIQGK
jgi:hypothetical protein